MVEKSNLRVEELAIPVKMHGQWPPDLSPLAGLGFDSVSVSSSAVMIKKAQSTGLAGRPHIFCELQLRRNSALLSYSVPKEADAALRRLQAISMLLRVLSILPKTEADASSLSSALLPALDSAAAVSTQPYELLSKKSADLRKEASELSAANRRLSSSSEDAASSILQLERTIAALEQRIKKLEHVSDAALREMVLEHVSSHRGSFNAAAFASSAGVSPARAEEGLEMLLQEGAIRKVGGSFAQQKPPTRGYYSQQEKGLVKSIRESAGSIIGKVRLPAPEQK